MMSLREYREPKHRLPDYLPWACLVAPGVVLQKDAVLQKTIAFRGPDLDSSLDSELISATARINNALRRLGSGLGALRRSAALRRPAATRRRASRTPRRGWSISERRRTFEAAGGHYESSYYMTFVWQMPPRSTAGSPPSSTTTRRVTLDVSDHASPGPSVLPEDRRRGRRHSGRACFPKWARSPTTRRSPTSTAPSRASATRCARPRRRCTSTRFSPTRR